jgi:transcriptional regulator with XRE-family HTH domain
VLREHNRLRSQERAAEEAGLNPRHLQKIEAGTVNVTLHTVARLSAAFGVDARRMFEP